MFVDDGHLILRVWCRERPSGAVLDAPVRYAIAMTIEAGVPLPVYEQVAIRLCGLKGAIAVGGSLLAPALCTVGRMREADWCHDGDETSPPGPWRCRCTVRTRYPWTDANSPLMHNVYAVLHVHQKKSWSAVDGDSRNSTCLKSLFRLTCL